MDKLKKFIEKSNKQHNFKYNYEKVEYINSLTKVCIICPEHGEFWQTPVAHVRGNQCPKCANIKRGDNKRWDNDKFIRESSKMHGLKYDYTKVDYCSANNKVCIICPEHGEFWQTPASHISGQGCPKCAGKNLEKNEVIERFIQKHGKFYNYSKVEYNGMHKKVCIICPEHGEFWQTPAKHILGQGCKECSNKKNGIEHRLNYDDFIKKSNKIHHFKYDYSKVEYITSHDKIEINCPKHGSFLQYPYDHIQGYGCPICGIQYSECENEIYNLLIKNIGKESIELHNRCILEGKEIDIYLPKYKIGIEFNGLRWHSEEFGKDKWYHYNKMIKANDKGIKLIQIFEDEYNDKKEIVFSKLLHIIGKCENLPKIMGRKCEIKEISHENALEFLNKNHIQGYGNSTIRLGAYFQDNLIAVMCFTKTEKKDIWILNRFASDNSYICQGIGGKLFNYFIKKYNPIEIKSFADRRWTINENNLYIKLGFKLDKVLNPDYRYVSNNKGRIHKFNLRKKTLHNKYDFPIDMTEKKMVEKLGLYKIWDCGLYRYIWKKHSI